MGDDLICIRFRFNSIWNSRNGSRALEQQFFQSLYGDNKREMSINFLSPCHKNLLYTLLDLARNMEKVATDKVK